MCHLLGSFIGKLLPSQVNCHLVGFGRDLLGTGSFYKNFRKNIKKKYMQFWISPYMGDGRIWIGGTGS